MTCVVVIMLSSFAGVMLSGEPSWTPHSRLEEWVDVSAGIICIKHSGGEPLSVEDMNVLIYINGTRYEYPAASISTNLGGKNTWELADVLAINPGQEWGRNITDGDTIRVALINEKEKVVVPQIRTSPEHEPTEPCTIYHTITASSGPGGIISPFGAVSLAENSSQVFSIVPASGYSIADVLVDNVPEGSVSNYTFSNVTSDHSIHAAFIKDSVFYTIFASAGANGNIFPAGNINVAENSNQDFFIVSNPGHRILYVLVDGSPVGSVSNYKFSNVSSDHSIHAGFCPDFDIVGGSVIPKASFSGNFTVLGSAIQSGSSDQSVTVRTRFGNDTFDPWGNYTNASEANVNNGVYPDLPWEFPASYSAGTPITIIARSWNLDNTIVHIEVDSGDVSQQQQVKVLKDGDTIPDIPGLDDQPPVEWFLKNYVENETRILKLGENEAIYLFELGVTNMDSTGADFQDLVILVSLS